MEKKKLLELAKQLNGLVDDDGNALASTKVKVVAVSDDKLKASFLDACESISEEKEELIPDDISEAYNEIIKDDPREGQKEEAEEEKVEEETKPTPKKKTEAKGEETKTKGKPVASKNVATSSKTKTSAKKEGAKDKKATKSKDEYGNMAGSMGEKVNSLLKKGTTEENIISDLMQNHGRDEQHAKSYFVGHIKWLEKNFNVNIETSPKTKKMSIVEGDKK